MSLDTQPAATDQAVRDRRARADASRTARAARTEEITGALARGPGSAERARLLDELIALNMPVATAIARRYRSRGIAEEDLEQVAFLALTKAAHRFDPTAGHAFLSFCVPTIRGEVRRHFRDHGWMVRPPRRLQELQHELLALRPDMAIRLGRLPTAEELAEETGKDVQDVLEALDGRGAFAPSSLDRSTGEPDGIPVGELLGNDDADQPAAEARVVLAPVVRRLSDRDRRILQLRFFEDCSQKEIAEDIGVTQMQVSRLLAGIFRRLRTEIGDTDGRLAG